MRDRRGRSQIEKYLMEGADMSKVPRVLAAGSIAAAILLGTAAGAQASGNKNEASFPVSCSTSGSSTFTGNAVIRRAIPTTRHPHKVRWFVLHVVGGAKHAKVLVPTAAQVTFTFTDANNNVQTTTENLSKKSHAGHQTSCTITGSSSIDGGTLQVSGSVTGAFH